MHSPITLSLFERAQACVMTVMYFCMLRSMVEYLLFLHENDGLAQASPKDLILCIFLVFVLCFASIVWMTTLGRKKLDRSDMISPESLELGLRAGPPKRKSVALSL
jgi:hypothetical protein